MLFFQIDLIKVYRVLALQTEKGRKDNVADSFVILFGLNWTSLHPIMKYAGSVKVIIYVIRGDYYYTEKVNWSMDPFWLKHLVHFQTNCAWSKFIGLSLMWVSRHRGTPTRTWYWQLRYNVGMCIAGRLALHTSSIRVLSSLNSMNYYSMEIKHTKSNTLLFQ